MEQSEIPGGLSRLISRTACSTQTRLLGPIGDCSSKTGARGRGRSRCGPGPSGSSCERGEHGPMLTIWGRANSINVQKVLWCCGEVGHQYDRIDAGGAFGVV